MLMGAIFLKFTVHNLIEVVTWTNKAEHAVQSYAAGVGSLGACRPWAMGFI